MSGWSAFAAVVGGSAAALTGLLFVAVSLRIELIARSTRLRIRAAQTLALFVTVLFVAILLSVPQQSHAALGGELIALALLASVALLGLDRRAGSEEDASIDTSVADLLEAVSPNILTSVLLLAAGILVCLGHRIGLDVLVVPVLFALLGGVTSAWVLLTRLSA